MNLSKKHQEIFDEAFPNGYSTDKLTVKTGKVIDESGYFHIMFIDIVKDGNWTRGVPCVQKYSVDEWIATKDIIEGTNERVHGNIHATGHDEYAIIHDPTAKAREAKATPKKAEVKPEVKPKGRPPQK